MLLGRRRGAADRLGASVGRRGLGLGSRVSYGRFSKLGPWGILDRGRLIRVTPERDQNFEVTIKGLRV